MVGLGPRTHRAHNLSRKHALLKNSTKKWAGQASLLLWGVGSKEASDKLARGRLAGGREAGLELPEPGVGRQPGPWQESNQRWPRERGSHLDPFKEER